MWVFYAAMQTGTPAKALATVLRLAPGFQIRSDAWVNGLALALAVLASLAWLALVRWRTGRHQEVIWKSLVLPAGGVALCWLLLMTLWLPLLDYARSNRPLAERLVRHMPLGCIAAPGAPTSLVAALEVHGKRRVDASPQAARGACQAMVIVVAQRGPSVARSQATAAAQAGQGWQAVARERRPTDRNEVVVVYRRSGAPTLPVQPPTPSR